MLLPVLGVWFLEGVWLKDASMNFTFGLLLAGVRSESGGARVGGRSTAKSYCWSCLVKCWQAFGLGLSVW